MEIIKNLITIDKEILGGQPVFKGTRVPIESLFVHLEKGISLDEFLEDFPSVSKEVAVAVLAVEEKIMTSKDADPESGEHYTWTNGDKLDYANSIEVEFAIGLVTPQQAEAIRKAKEAYDKRKQKTPPQEADTKAKLKEVFKTLFGLNEEQADANADVYFGVFNVMAKRAGITLEEALQRVKYAMEDPNLKGGEFHAEYEGAKQWGEDGSQDPADVLNEIVKELMLATRGDKKKIIQAFETYGLEADMLAGIKENIDALMESAANSSTESEAAKYASKKEKTP